MTERRFAALVVALSIAAIAAVDALPRARAAADASVDATGADRAVGAIRVRPWFSGCECLCDPAPRIWVFIDDDALHVAVSRLAIAPRRIERDGGEWTQLAAALAELKAEDAFAERDDLHIAGGGWSGAPVTLDELVDGFEIARAAGFTDIHLGPADAMPEPTRWRTLSAGPP